MSATSSTPELLGIQASFGFGDRIGFATPGHVLAVQQAGGRIQPIFAQQSIREMERTGRSPETVMADALRGIQQAGWTGKHGADADHLKTAADIDRTAAAGFVFFTIDPSERVDGRADNYTLAELREKFAPLRDTVTWVDSYRGKSIQLPTGTTIRLDEEACLRCAVKYGGAIQLALELAEHIRNVQEGAGRGYEIELSVDETDQPTALAEHYIIADQCLAAGMRLVSLAPRFLGDFEGVDYRGDIQALEKSLSDHAAIARLLGPYKLSLHSGSDKISMYPALARATMGCFHVKTAGTSYLEALRVAARRDPAFFRQIIHFSRACYDRDKATYHVSATLAAVPPADQVADTAQLIDLYLEDWSRVAPGRGLSQPGRQILHCTFGSVIKDPPMGGHLRSLLKAHQDDYTEVLAEHFVHHLEPLVC